MKIYKLKVESEFCEDVLFEDYYVNKDNAVNAALDWITNKNRKDLQNVYFKEMGSGDIDFYTVKNSPLYWICVEAIDTID